jgi:hypothetical protein
MDESSPVYVKIDEYKEILDIVNVIKKKLAESKELLDKINQLKAEEDQEILAWEKNVTDFSQKVEFIDRTLFQPKI